MTWVWLDIFFFFEILAFAHFSTLLDNVFRSISVSFELGLVASYYLFVEIHVFPLVSCLVDNMFGSVSIRLELGLTLHWLSWSGFALLWSIWSGFGWFYLVDLSYCLVDLKYHLAKFWVGFTFRAWWEKLHWGHRLVEHVLKCVLLWI